MPSKTDICVKVHISYDECSYYRSNKWSYKVWQEFKDWVQNDYHFNGALERKVAEFVRDFEDYNFDENGKFWGDR